MQTKLSRYCEGLLEAVWLAAVAVIPLYFNVFSSRIFEPDKVSLLRTLAIVALIAWIVLILETNEIQKISFSQLRHSLRWINRTPFILPVLLLTLSYLLSSFLSIVPETSFTGSYQRMQGTYTFFSYLIIFFALVINLKNREQVSRLISIIILTSLPVALYGILQRYGLDPVPWGGNVQNRIAANMGNSIFVAAYLIMVLPLTGMRIIVTFRKILLEENQQAATIIRSTLYIFIGILTLIAVYLSGSRGPFLGLLAGFFFLFVLLALYWQRRYLLIAVLGIAGAGAVLLLLLNIPNGPLRAVREAPYVGRLGQMLDMDQRTSRVRTLIWQGAADLVLPHAAIEYPDGKSDALNWLRPWIGYGPESMYVAYNRFYPPGLAQVEKRNASPDRSHNETWDALVQTGLFGFAASQFLYLSIFYFGLKWLGLIHTQAQRNVFLALVLGIGAVTATGLVVWQGIGFLGVGIPFGEILGILVYLTLFALFRTLPDEYRQADPERSLLMIALIAAICAHFVEVHFGIAIAATRLYFWVFAGMLLAAGVLLPKKEIFELTHEIQDPKGEDRGSEVNESGRVRKDPLENKSTRTRKGSRKRLSPQPGSRLNFIFSKSWRRIVINTLLTGMITGTLVFDYLNNLTQSSSPVDILKTSFFSLPTENFVPSPGIFGLLLFVWITAALILGTEPDTTEQLENSNRTKEIGLTLLGSALITLIFSLWQAGKLASIFKTVPQKQAELLEQIHTYANLPIWLLFYLLALLFGLGWFLPALWGNWTTYRRWTSLAVSVILVPAALIFTFTTNLEPIQADIMFKLASPYAQNNQWPGAILIYREALDKAPGEDHYYLFLGRAYLEYARSLTDPAEKQAFMQQAVDDLKVAQELNPLNTDHTANLARLYSYWGATVSGNAQKQEYLERANQYYQQAINLSPNNAVLWMEYAVLQLNALDNSTGALESAETARALDPSYDRIYALLGDYFVQAANSSEDPAEQKQHYFQAAENYQQAIESLAKTPANYPVLYTYSLALGGVYLELLQTVQANLAYQDAYQYAGSVDKWRVAETIARLYQQVHDRERAIQWANIAQSDAPESEADRLRQLINQIETAP